MRHGAVADSAREEGALRLWSGAAGGFGDFLLGLQHQAKTELWDWTLEPRDAYEGNVDPEGSPDLLALNRR